MAQRVAVYGIMTALAFVLSWIERLFPPISAVPGVKLGLANVVVLIMLYYRGFRPAIYVSLLRVLIVGFVFANVSTMLYSLAGGLFSLCMMGLAKRAGLFSPVGVSVIGAVCHNVGQILLAMWMLGSALLINYLPVLLIAGVLTGVATGVAAMGALRYLKALPEHTKKHKEA